MMSMISEATKIYDRYNPFPPSMSPKGRIFPQKKPIIFHEIALWWIFPQFLSLIFLAKRNKNRAFSGPPARRSRSATAASASAIHRATYATAAFFSVPGGETETATKVGMSIILWGHTYIISYIYMYYCIYIIICIYICIIMYIYICTNIHNGIYIYIIRTMTF